MKRFKVYFISNCGDNMICKIDNVCTINEAMVKTHRDYPVKEILSIVKLL